MPLSLLPYPKCDPVLISFGPFAMRSYALAYIVGILLGWICARTLVADDRYWSGPTRPGAVTDLDGFVLWVTLGIILGGRTGYVLFYYFHRAFIRDRAIVERRHGVPRLGCVLAVMLFAWKRGISFLSLGDLACRPNGIFLVRLANFVLRRRRFRRLCAARQTVRST